MRRIAWILVFLFVLNAAGAQNQALLTHYTTDDGLSQNTVVSVHKDRKGLMWFGTWDGLNRFDGYQFTVYKGNPDPLDENSPLHTRIDWIREDKDGYLWLKTYDDLLYRFDPRKERFLRASPVRKGSEGYLKAKKVWVLRNGSVWSSFGPDVFFRIQNGAKETLRIDEPFNPDQLKSLGSIHQVFDDAEGTTWMLGNQGLARLQIEETKPALLQTRPFFCSLEQGNRLYFGSDRGTVLSYDKKTGTFNSLQTALKGTITEFAALPDGRLMVVSPGEGFLLLQPKTGAFERYHTQSFPSMRSNQVSSPYVDSRGEIWMALDAPGVLHFNPKQRTFDYLWKPTPAGVRSSATPAGFFVFEDALGTLWVRLKEGSLFSYDRGRNTLNWFYNNPADPSSVFRTNIQVAWADSEGILWICAGNQGIFKCVHRKRNFRFTSMEGYIHNGTPDIRSLYRDAAGRVWVGSKAGELRLMDKNRNSPGVLCKDGTFRSAGDLKLSVYSILQDRKGRIWLATKGQGLVLLEPANREFSSFKTTFFQRDGSTYGLPSNNLYDLYEDRQGRIWIASYEGGLILLDETNGAFRFLHEGNDLSHYPGEACPRVRCVDGDKNGNIWVGTTNGFVVFSEKFRHPRDIKFYHYNRDYKELKALNLSDIYQLLCDSKGNVWFGTFGGGLIVCKHFKLGQEPELQGYDTQTGFHTDIVLSLVEDRQQKLWLTSENVLARFDPESGDCDRYSLANGLDAGDFLEASAFVANDGTLLFGNSKGFYEFNPARVERNRFAPRIALTKLQIFGRDAVVGGEGSPLQQHLDDCTSIKLTSKQRTFSIEFAALDYQTPENIQYAYMLEGFDENWNTLQKSRLATYTSVPRGKYTLLVRCTNSDGVWSNQIRQLEIRVQPSFWQTIWAYLLYLIFGGLAVWGILYLFYFYLKLKNGIVLEQQLSELKLRFFTDISHELRTPLTLISAPVEQVLKVKELPDAVRGQLLTVQRNTERMNRLLNQILDFRKIQSKKMRLRLVETDFGACVRKTCSNFEEIAREKHLGFVVEDASEGALIWVDPDHLDTIVFNLLSNAFKFTPSEHEIRVRVEASEGEVILKVEDQGVGIEKARLSMIFDRFYSLDEHVEAHKRSTGIGLSLVRELVELHGATVSVDSQPGQGTTFEVRFKRGMEHFGKDADFVLADETVLDLQSCSEEKNEAETGTHREDMQMVLIAEDNADLRRFLRSVLGHRYRVAEAADGESAWEMTQSLMPDFIITDLMMPRLSGNEFVRLVKNDDRTCHIPLVVLTAKTNMDSRLECLELGADDYITKPFSAAFLEARVGNLLEQRHKLQSVYRDRIFPTDTRNNGVEIEVPMPQAHSRDEEFMERLMNVMEKNISNGSFSVEQLCSMAGYGRTVFFNKLKSLTGLSPNEYIREVRIKRAAQLLEVGEYTVSQITYMVGMNDSRYFSKCFKQRYGVTPTEYRENLHRDQERISD